MTRKLKTLGLALIAVLALAVVAVPTAAAEFTVRAAEYPATLDGTSVESTIFNFGGREVVCKKTTFGATLEEASNALVIGREYSECSLKFLGSLPTTFTMNGCAFETHLLRLFNADIYEASVDIVCEGAAGIEIYVYASEAEDKAGNPTCTYEIPPQKGREVVEFNDMTEQADITVTPRVKGIEYKIFKGPMFVCGLEGNNGTYSGSTTATATNKGGKAIGLEVK